MTSRSLASSKSATEKPCVHVPGHACIFVCMCTQPSDNASAPLLLSTVISPPTCRCVNMLLCLSSPRALSSYPPSNQPSRHLVFSSFILLVIHIVIFLQMARVLSLCFVTVITATVTQTHARTHACMHTHTHTTLPKKKAFLNAFKPTSMSIFTHFGKTSQESRHLDFLSI